jgi:hypothetical protein
VVRSMSQSEPFTILVSASLPAGCVVAIAVNALVASVELPMIDASQQAIVHEETVPAAIVDIGSGVMAHPVRSSFQTDSVVLRLRWPITWALRSPAGVAVVEGATW